MNFQTCLTVFLYFENCPRKIRDKERSDVNEFFEWRLEKVSNCWLRSVGSNYDTRLDFYFTNDCILYLRLALAQRINYNTCSMAQIMLFSSAIPMPAIS